MTPLLEARELGQVFGTGDKRTVALENLTLSFDADTPSFTAIVGESGSGKTTLARSLLGFLRPSSGAVYFRGEDLYSTGGAGLRRFRREVQAIFQDPFEVYNPFYTVDHMLATPIRKFGLAPSRTQARDLMERSLRAVGLEPKETLGRYPHQLSGGQRQRLTVARALLIGPRLIIADEPVSMIDASLRATVLESLRRLHEDFDISFVYITHDLTTAYQVSDNVIVLYRGRVAEVGDVEQVIKQPEHPYTQLLVGSIPIADPDRPWAEDINVPEAGERELDREHACAFADRCPQVMPRCTQSPPPLYRTHDNRAVSCFLYDRDGEETVEGDVRKIFRSSDLRPDPAGGDGRRNQTDPA